MDINKAREVLNEEISNIDLPIVPANLYEPIGYIMSLGGKRMRPILALMGCELFGGEMEDAVRPAIGIEVFHNFSLVHDDIMDAAPLRRGQQTVHEKWDPNIAILAGDAMMIMAYRFLMQVPKDKLPEILDLFNQTALKVCEGQQLDMDFESNSDVTIAEYLQMIEYKTAVLLGCSLKIGALIGGAPEKEAKLLYDFGINTGLAFQIQDDYLDAFGESGQFGKQSGGDIRANKKTFLYLKALEYASEQQHQRLKELFSEKTINEEEKVEEVLDLFNRLGVQRATRREMDRYHRFALEALAQINQPSEQKQPLIDLTEKLLVRDH